MNFTLIEKKKGQVEMERLLHFCKSPLMYVLLLGTVLAHALEKKCDPKQIKEMNSLWKIAIESIPEYPGNAFEGRGIVIPAGGVNYIMNAWVTLNMLRETGCTLPVEIWYIGEKEIVPDVMQKMTLLGATCKDVTEYFDYPIKGWEVKPHAILASQFREVLLIDADNMPMRDPDFLFEEQAYLETGALFWADAMIIEKQNPVLQVLELKKEDLRCQESGQIVIDKARCWLPLQLCVHLNRYSEFYYRFILGDKDTFMLSWLALDASFAFNSYLPGIILKSCTIANKFSCFLQRDFKGKPLFCHTVNYNWAERNTERHLWNFFLLPKQKCYYLHPVYPFQEKDYKVFRLHYPNFENQCIEYWKQVSYLGSTCQKDY